MNFDYDFDENQNCVSGSNTCTMGRAWLDKMGIQSEVHLHLALVQVYIATSALVPHLVKAQRTSTIHSAIKQGKS